MPRLLPRASFTLSFVSCIPFPPPPPPHTWPVGQARVYRIGTAAVLLQLPLLLRVPFALFPSCRCSPSTPSPLTHTHTSSSLTLPTKARRPLVAARVPREQQARAPARLWWSIAPLEFVGRVVALPCASIVAHVGWCLPLLFFLHSTSLPLVFGLCAFLYFIQAEKCCVCVLFETTLLFLLLCTLSSVPTWVLPRQMQPRSLPPCPPPPPGADNHATASRLTEPRNVGRFFLCQIFILPSFEPLTSSCPDYHTLPTRRAPSDGQSLLDRAHCLFETFTPLMASSFPAPADCACPPLFAPSLLRLSCAFPRALFSQCVVCRVQKKTKYTTTKYRCLLSRHAEAIAALPAPRGVALFFSPSDRLEHPSLQEAVRRGRPGGTLTAAAKEGESARSFFALFCTRRSKQGNYTPPLHVTACLAGQNVEWRLEATWSVPHAGGRGGGQARFPPGFRRFAGSSCA